MALSTLRNLLSTFQDVFLGGFDREVCHGWDGLGWLECIVRRLTGSLRFTVLERMKVRFLQIILSWAGTWLWRVSWRFKVIQGKEDTVFILLGICRRRQGTRATSDNLKQPATGM
jgi:hypothetical protein